jgi:hypothetical protein
MNRRELVEREAPNAAWAEAARVPKRDLQASPRRVREQAQV